MTSMPRNEETINQEAIQARDYLEHMVSVYRSSVDTQGGDRTFRSVLEEVRDRRLSGLIAEVRQLHQAIPPLPAGLLPDDTKGIATWKKSDPGAHAVWHEATGRYNAAKRRLPAFINSGTFRSYHRHGETPTPQHLERFPDCSSTGLREHTGTVVLDLDHLEAHGANREELLEWFGDHPAVLGAYVSPGDDGLKVFVAVHPVPWDDDSHVRAFAAAKDAVADIYSDVDPSGKNVSRMCYLSDHPTCYIAPDDKGITPMRWEPGEEPDPKPTAKPDPKAKPRGAPRTGPRFENCDTRLERHQAMNALKFLAAAGVGGDDNALVGVGVCMKSMGHPFQEWDEWAGSAGCSCSNRQARWSSFRATDRDYTAIIGMAYNMGWLRGPDAQGNAQDFPPGIPLRPDFDAMRASGWMMDSRKRLTRGANINGLLALEALGLRYRYDEWAEVIQDDAGDPVDLNELPDRLKCTIERAFVRVNYCPTLGAVEAAVRIMARDAAFNSVVDRLRRTEWNGEDLLAHFGAIVFGTPDEALYNDQASLLPRGAVVRALEPGAVFPYIPVLYSRRHGTAKGDSLRIIAPGGFFSGVCFAGFDWEKKLGEKLPGVSIAEVAELNGFRTDELRNAKDLATRTEVLYRASYARASESRPLQAIIVATTNHHAVLTDSEHRRNPVIEVPEGREVNLEWLRQNIDQVWAQVVREYDDGRYREDGGTAVRLPRDLWEAANENAEQHVVEDGLEVWLGVYCAGKERIKSSELWAAMLGPNGPGPVQNNAFSVAMGKLGYVRGNLTFEDGKAKGWSRTEKA